jgi:SpoVK/Ycf46/Vps4 family AAA+-type ATPase
MKNQFFQLWDGLRTNAVERVLVMGVTNRPFDLDDAVLRRFQRRLLIDVPNSCLRAKVLKHMLRNDEIEEGAVAEEISRDEITGGFTGSDLKNLCIAAAYRPLREMLDAEAAIDASKSDLVVPLKPRKLRLKDFEVAAKEISSSISEDSMGSMELRKWNETYGDGGSRLKANLPYFL